MLSSLGLATGQRARVIGVRSVFSSLARISTCTAAPPKVPTSIRIAAVFNRGFAAAATRSATKTATTTKKTTATKNPAAKKTTAAGQKKKATTKATAKKAAPKKKAVSKKKKTARPKKAPEEVPESLKLYRKAKELRATALIKEQPTLLPANPWLIYRSKHANEVPSTGAIDISRGLKKQFEALSSVERQTLDDEARANKVRNDATLISWATTYPVTTIEAANRARTRLRRLGKASRSAIHDPRRPKGVRSAFSWYVSKRLTSGDFDGVPVTTKMPACASEWKTMSEADRKPYLEAYLADKARHQVERASLSPSP
ncbi:hypothetical protein QBC36DRAFT_11618 [Triangularia setosa]|uniref:HMG box domain-containing protein n=1 Tax=Triangularia setosa TaxID=2587417 RepID=A0AAN7A5Q9_9PEZI|nr:hypothetical protein QBC36DRAFT_11618 [Podospora setosa]